MQVALIALLPTYCLLSTVSPYRDFSAPALQSANTCFGLFVYKRSPALARALSLPLFFHLAVETASISFCWDRRCPRSAQPRRSCSKFPWRLGIHELPEYECAQYEKQAGFRGLTTYNTGGCH